MLNERGDICFYTYQISFIASIIFCSVSLLTLTVISVDRLLALLLGLRYRQVLTFQRILAFLIAFWIYSVGSTLSSFGNPLIQKLLWFTCVTLFLCLVTLVLSYTKILFTLRHNLVQVQDHLPQEQPTQIMNMARYKRAVSSALWVTTTAVVCYLPYGVAETVILQEEMTIDLPYRAFCDNLSLLELIFKPVALLLEDQRSKASCERYIKASLLFTEQIDITFLNIVGNFCFVLRQPLLKNKYSILNRISKHTNVL